MPTNLISGFATAYCPYCQAKNSAWVGNQEVKMGMSCQHFKRVEMRPELNDPLRKLWNERAAATCVERFKKEWLKLDKVRKIPHFIFQITVKKEHNT